MGRRSSVLDSKFGVLPPLVIAILAGGRECLAAEASGHSGGWFNKPSSSGSWSSPKPDAALAATLTWTSGPNTADGTPYPLVTYPTAPDLPIHKFVNNGGGFPQGIPVVSVFSRDCPGDYGSVSTTSGTASSTVGVFNYTCNFTVTADGTLGNNPNPPPNPEWSSKATGKDPWPDFSDDVPDPSQLTYDVYIPVGIGGSPGNGSISFSTSYETADTMLPLLDITATPNSVTVTGDADASYYLLSAIDAAPTTDPGNQVSLDWIQASLLNEIDASGSISPLYIGICVDGIAIPTTDMGNGVVAIVHDDIQATDQATIPEPATLSLLSLGELAVLRRRRKL